MYFFQEVFFEEQSDTHFTMKKNKRDPFGLLITLHLQIHDLPYRTELVDYLFSAHLAS